MAKEIFAFTREGCLVVQRGTRVELIADEDAVLEFLTKHYDRRLAQ